MVEAIKSLRPVGFINTSTNLWKISQAPFAVHWFVMPLAAPLKLAVVGIGRMGVIHALHAQELARESGRCALAALVDSNLDRARSRSEERRVGKECRPR